MVITTIYGRGEPSHVAINVHSKYSYMVEGSTHMCSTAKEGGPFSLITRPFPQYGGKLQQIRT